MSFENSTRRHVGVVIMEEGLDSDFAVPDLGLMEALQGPENQELIRQTNLSKVNLRCPSEEC